ncbi:MAG: hypothetical protein WDW38_004954 [Sanguina aurantia]
MAIPSELNTTRQFRRTVFDFDKWEQHRSVMRYVNNLASIPNSRIIRTLVTPLSLVLTFATVFGVYETCVDEHILPAFFPGLSLPSVEAEGLTSFALSLLLVFRTNSSYDRFDEARKIWGSVVNRSRTLTNQAIAYTSTEDIAGREAIAKWTIGFTQALRAHLQQDCDLRVELANATPAWSEQEIDMLAKSHHRPVKALSVLSELITQTPNITGYQIQQMLDQVAYFHDSLGGCERLLRTPIPLSYTRHTARFLILWLSFLPLGLWDKYHWAMLPVTALIGFLLLGIDEIGVQIEEPFGILPLFQFCSTIEKDLNSMLADEGQVSGYVSSLRHGTAFSMTSDGPMTSALIAKATNQTVEELSIPGLSAHKVAYQGVPGAYSEVASRKACPEFEPLPCDQFEVAFQALSQWMSDRAVLPIENSLGGSIHAVYDLLLRYRLHIVGETSLAINHCLVALPGTRLQDVKRVMSHPQALAQCDLYLRKLGVVKEAVDDTAGAAQTVARLQLVGVGAVCSRRAAELYGLDVLEEGVQDVKDNITRFIVLSRDPLVSSEQETRVFKTSVVFSLGKGPGQLFKALSVFALRDIDMTKIESRPLRSNPLVDFQASSDSSDGDDVNAAVGQRFNYLFYVDFVGTLAEVRCQNALRHLQEIAPLLRVLGTYPMDVAGATSSDDTSALGGRRK